MQEEAMPPVPETVKLFVYVHFVSIFSENVVNCAIKRDS